MAFTGFNFGNRELEVDRFEEEIQRLESEKAYLETQSITLEQKLTSKEIKKKDYESLLKELYLGKTKEDMQNLIDEKINALRKDHKIKQEGNKKKSLITAGSAVALILVLSFAGLFYANSGGLTGLAIGDIPIENTYTFDRTFTSNSDVPLDMESLLGLRISGTLDGTGASVRLVSGESSFVVADISGSASETYTLQIDKREYNLGEPIQITIDPSDSTASIYVLYNDQNTLLDSTTYTPQETGTYTIFALITTDSDIYRLEVNTTVVTSNAAIDAGASASVTETTEGEFTSICDETCLLQTELENPRLLVSLDDGSTLTISTLYTVEVSESSAPQQIIQFTDVQVQTGDTLTIQLSDYFTDADNDELSYDFSQVDGIEVVIDGDNLEITGTTPGVYSGNAYVTDGVNLVNGNDFTITVAGDVETEITDDQTDDNTTTDNETLPVGNSTENNPPESLTDCNDPNPNRRPLSCIEGSESSYFSSRPIYLENGNREQVARVTTFGNIIITGELVESTTARPQSNDFRISYLGSDSQTEINSAWIDTATGSLHLTGNLYEEQLSLVPPSPDAYQIQNQKGITLAYFDRRNGDLYIRGNLIVEKPEASLIPVEQIAQE